MDALRNSDGEDVSPVTIGVCDSGALYSEEKFQNLITDDDVDVIVWGIRVMQMRFGIRNVWLD